MINLAYRNGRQYIGNLEVVAYPIGPLNVINIVTENGKLPPVEVALSKTLPEIISQNPFLLKANCYYLAVVGEQIKPKMETPDGAVPEQRIGRVVLQFFKAVPATPENRKSLEDIFRSPI